ncbi:MAG: PilZ domain-containing protein [Nitrospirota bacterium]
MLRQGIEKRLSRRVHIRLEAYVLTDQKTYTGQIQNVSKDGFEYLIDSSVTDPDVFRYGQTVEFCFQVPTGEVINMFCTVMWRSNNLPDEKSLTIGMKIAEPSPKFKYLIEPLQIVSVN